jgi:hypothetical protein
VTMNRRFVLLLSATVVVFALALAVRTGRLGAPSPEATRVGGGYSLNQVPTSATAQALAADTEQRRKRFASWARGQTPFDSAEEASGALAFHLRTPSAILTSPTVVYVSKNSRIEERGAYLVFGDPVAGPVLLATPSKEAADFSKQVSEDRVNLASGTNTADRASQLLAVGGRAAIGNEPGYNLIGEDKVPRPGFVVWWDDGVSYELYGTSGIGGTPLADLLVIAESMYAK